MFYAEKSTNHPMNPHFYEKSTASAMGQSIPNDKVYVAVELQNDTSGNVHPLRILWEDGRTFEIAHIYEVRRMASTKAGGTGMRYRIRVGNKDTFLWHEFDRWFVERG